MLECIFRSMAKACWNCIVVQTVTYPLLSTYNIEFMQQSEHSRVFTGEGLWLLCKWSSVLLSPFALAELVEVRILRFFYSRSSLVLQSFNPILIRRQQDTSNPNPVWVR